MARISGVDLPRNKKIEYALSYIYGIGLTTSRIILKNTNINFNTKVSELTENEVVALRKEIGDNNVVEGELRGQVGRDIKRLIDIGSYRGTRHKKGLPCRGQNTKNNSRTKKGRKKTVANKKQVT